MTSNFSVKAAFWLGGDRLKPIGDETFLKMQVGECLEPKMVLKVISEDHETYYVGDNGALWSLLASKGRTVGSLGDPIVSIRKVLPVSYNRPFNSWTMKEVFTALEEQADGEGVTLADLRYAFQERASVREYDGNQSRIDAESEAIREVMPFLTENGELRLTFDCPQRYKWWDQGQSVGVTLMELGASQETIDRYCSQPTGHFLKRGLQ